ncbi:hypothetical protein tb265_45350 [Gemmatimonadetes bacterium T265]|nr:hypothetical protein tb265_45350 [Gemmatimonadetes bacterium T265]
MARPHPSSLVRAGRRAAPAALGVAALAAVSGTSPRAPAAPASAPATAPTPALTEVGFDSKRWTFVGGPATRTVVEGDTTWTVPGFALLPDVDLADGLVEFDVRSTTFPAVVFHAHSPEEYETVYLRMDRSGQPDALQYSPVFRRFLPWRLYPDGQAAAPLDTARPTHVRLEVRGRTARVTVDRAAAPQLVVALRHPAQGGAVGVWNSSGTQRFSHFRYAALSGAPKAEADFARTGPAAPGALTAWGLSPLLIGATLDGYRAPARDSARGWRPITADADGLVNVSRYYSALASEGHVTPVAARTVLTRGRAGAARLAFGYCDRAAVFLNGQRVFAGTLPLRRGGDFPRMLARDTVPLPLRAGRNDLVVVTTGNTYGDRNGGWGFVARLVPGSEPGAP